MSALIRWQTRGKFSHVGVLFDDGVFFEAWCGSGKGLWTDGGVIKKTNWRADPDVVVVPIPLDELGAAAARLYAESQVGKRYDFRSAARFLTRIKPRSNDKFFCSELAMNIFRAGGINLLHAPASVVSPAVLWFSPTVGENL